MIKNSFIYTGNVVHKRFKPKIHFFKYKVFSLLLDLSEIHLLDKNLHHPQTLFYKLDHTIDVDSKKDLEKFMGGT